MRGLGFPFSGAKRLSHYVFGNRLVACRCLLAVFMVCAGGGGRLPFSARQERVCDGKDEVASGGVECCGS